MVAIRAVNSDPAHASPWVNSEVIRPIQPQLSNVSHTRTDGQIVLSWDPNLWTTGYEIYCGEHNPPATTYTLCATLTDQDDTAARHNVTLTSWTAGGTNYSIDNTSTYHIQIVSTNKWSSLGWFAPLIYPYFLSVSGITATDATLTIAGHTGQWWYKADAGPHTTCQGPVSGSSKALTGLSAQTSYTYSAYSASGCASANLLATAASFFTTPFPYVSNLTSAKQNTASQISIGTRQAVAFTTGAHTEGYVLKSVTVPLKSVNASGGTNGLQLKLYQMDGTEQYGSNSAPSDTVLATLSGTAPTASTWSDTTWTCSGDGCSLSANTVYFVVATFDGTGEYKWAFATSETQTAKPSSNGWDIEYGHFKEDSPSPRDWNSWGDYNLAAVAFVAKGPTLTPSNLTATGATLTIAGRTSDWYYKYISPSGGTCSSAVSGSSTTVTMGAGSYTFAAYSDASCSNLLATTVAFSKTSTPAAPSSPTAVATAEKHLSASWQQPLWATKYHVTYTCNDGGDWGLVANGSVDSEGNLSQTGQTVTATVDLSAGWWNNQSPACRMAVRAGNHNGWSSWANSNSVTPQ